MPDLVLNIWLMDYWSKIRCQRCILWMLTWYESEFEKNVQSVIRIQRLLNALTDQTICRKVILKINLWKVILKITFTWKVILKITFTLNDNIKRNSTYRNIVLKRSRSHPWKRFGKSFGWKIKKLPLHFLFWYMLKL